MRWGIAFELPTRHLLKLENWPNPSHVAHYMTLDGKSDRATVFYCFEHPPQSWRETQRIAAIKIQMQRQLKALRFKEYEPPGDITGNVWKVSELGSYFDEFIKFPKPQFPGDKKEAYKMLCRHAKRLYYEGLLHYEQILATADRFNVALKSPLGYRQVMRQAAGVYRFALEHKDAWREKLKPRELAEAYKKGGVIRGDQRKAEAEANRLKIKEALPRCMKPNGNPDIKCLMDETGLSRRTIYNYL